MSVGSPGSADITLVTGFLNTVNLDEGTDLLDEPAAWVRWAAGHGLTAGPAPAARAARDALRARLGDPRLERSPLRVPVGIELGDHGAMITAGDAVGAVFAAAARLTVLGEWVRIKLCPACLWAFHDGSRNRSRVWCSMRECGNREKARAWRARALRG